MPISVPSAAFEDPTDTGTGRVCGASASSAPSRMISSTPRLCRPCTSSSLNARQRMFGSMPCTRTTSRDRPVGGAMAMSAALGGWARASEILVVGQISR